MLYFIFGAIALIVGGLIFVAIVYHMIQLVVGLAAIAIGVGIFVFLVQLEYPYNLIFSLLYIAFIIFLVIIGYRRKNGKQDQRLVFETIIHKGEYYE